MNLTPLNLKINHKFTFYSALSDAQRIVEIALKFVMNHNSHKKNKY